MDTTPVTRRTMLSIGGLLLLSACSAQASTPPTAPRGPRPTTAALPANPHPASPPSPSASPPMSDSPEFYIHKGPRAIALTIDDGPDPEWTPQVLRLLRRHQITATFCQVGEQISENRDLVRAVAADGHLIANHTWSHLDLARATPATIHDQLERTSDVIEQASGQRPTLFRAPYGAWSKQTIAICRQLSLRPLDWSVDPRDWDRPGTGRIIHGILAHTRPGSIILEHDGGGNRSQTLAALRVVLPRLLDAGYQFVTP